MKKGQLTVASILMVVCAILVLVYLFIPQVRNTTQSQPTSQTIEKLGAAASVQNTTLANVPIEASTLNIPGLTLNTNYTLASATTGLIRFNGTASGNYSVGYNYYTGNYLSTGTERALMVLVILASLIGLIYVIMRLAGLA